MIIIGNYHNHYLKLENINYIFWKTRNETQHGPKKLVGTQGEYTLHSLLHELII